jgi:hypothetical protein
LFKYIAPCTEDFFNRPNFPCFRLLQSSKFYSWVRGCKVGIQIYFSCGDSRRGFFLSSWGYHIRGEVDHLVGASCESGANTNMSGSRISQGLLVLRTAGGEANLFRGHHRAGGGLGTPQGAPGVHRG